MEVVERKRSRGGFLNLFDWPGKSRKKKLFASGSSELSEEPKQTKQNAQNLLKPSLSEVDKIGKNWNYVPRSDTSCCASSVTSDDVQGTRPPSVVARLMGLESLPVPNVQEPPDPDPFFFRHSRNTNKWNAYENLGYVNLRSDYDGLNRPIERFQSETFPPRLAKPIAVANNRLLSPIRSPGFVPSRNPVYVMEAASRMIEPSSRMVTRTRFSTPSDSLSSVPMMIRDLREKLKAAKKVSQHHQVSSSNDTFNEKRASSTSVTTPLTSKSGLKSKARLPHVSAQAKASSTPLSVTRISNASHKEKAEPRKRIVKSQNGLGGPPISTGKSVLKQHEEKQNCRDNQRLVTRKKTLPRSKKPPNGTQECGISNDKRIKRGENVIQCNITIDGCFHPGKDDGKKDVDVISFTFSSPIKGLSSDSLSSTQVTDQDTAASFDMFGGNSLNVLLEQSLRELTSKLESSSCSLTQEKPSRSSEYDKSTQNGLDKVLSESESVSDCTSFYDKQKLQIMDAEEHEVSSISTVTEADDLRSSCSKGISDCRKTTERLDWELEYISVILGSDQLMVKEFALGMATDILPASLFNEMEGRGEATATKLKRKTLFDFVNNCLAFKCEQMFRGSCRGLLWKEGILFEHRDWLAEELNREIHGLKKMREMMMDELVEKEMSSLEGSWLDFERETYEEGIDIEGEIVSTLVDDLVNELAFQRRTLKRKVLVSALF